jgi:hypothetical protein
VLENTQGSSVFYVSFEYWLLCVAVMACKCRMLCTTDVFNNIGRLWATRFGVVIDCRQSVVEPS